MSAKIKKKKEGEGGGERELREREKRKGGWWEREGKERKRALSRLIDKSDHRIRFFSFVFLLAINRYNSKIITIRISIE